MSWFNFIDRQYHAVVSELNTVVKAVNIAGTLSGRSGWSISSLTFSRLNYMV